MGYQAQLPASYYAPTPHQLIIKSLSGTSMTSKQVKKAFKERQKQNQCTWEEMREIEAELRRDDEQWKKEQRLEQQRLKRKEKMDRLKLEKEALRRKPGPVPAKWAADEPKARITDFFRLQTVTVSNNTVNRGKVVITID
jgi:flagellar biosynthesis GTPase FlhF